MAVGGAEEHFAKKLANNDKRIRDRAVRRLQAWIGSRPSTGPGFNELELLKVWKGLFYCFWMSDKPLIQEELADNISKLQHSFKNIDSGLNFIVTFFKTFHREWHGIDRLRLDKFYMLIRMFVKENFDLLNRNNWESSLCTKLSTIYKNGPLCPTLENVPVGIRLHLCSIFLSELEKVKCDEIPSDATLTLLEPFFNLAAEVKSQVISKAIKEGIFEKLLEIDSRLVMQNGNGPDDEEGNKTALKINLQGISDKLFTLASSREILGRNRNMLYLYIKKFKKCASETTETAEVTGKRKLDEKEDNKEDDVSSKKRKKKKKTKTVEAEENEKDDEVVLHLNGTGAKKRKRKKKAAALDENQNEEVTVKTKKKKKAKPTKDNNCTGNGDLNGMDHPAEDEELIEKQTNVLNNETPKEDTEEKQAAEEAVEKALKEIRQKTTETQAKVQTPKGRKNKSANDLTPYAFATFTRAKTPPAYVKKPKPHTEPKKLKDTKKLSTPKSAPHLTPPKKVTILLSKNAAQTPSDYAKSVTDSPSIPYDAKRSPAFGLLKTKPTPKSKTFKPTKKRSKAVDFF